MIFRGKITHAELGWFLILQPSRSKTLSVSLQVTTQQHLINLRLESVLEQHTFIVVAGMSDMWQLGMHARIVDATAFKFH